MIVIVMGVSGCGKSTVGDRLAKELGWAFADADDFHSASSKSKMAAAIPLTDTDRWPWLKSIHEQLLNWIKAGENGVFSCSALKKSYRNMLRSGQPKDSSDSVENIPATSLITCSDMTETTSKSFSQNPLFVHLMGSMEVILPRMKRRQGHFMDPLLLESQFQTLEKLEEDEFHISLNVDQSDVANIVEQIVTFITKSD